jgi:hypothetical protein
VARKYFITGEQVVDTKALAGDRIVVKLRRRFVRDGAEEITNTWQEMSFSEYLSRRLPLHQQPHS